MKTILRLALCASLLSGCIAHHTVRPLRPGQGAPATKNPGTLTYSITGGSPFGGSEELRTILREEAPFENVENVAERPARGRHVEVRVEVIPPNIAAFAWGYVAVAVFLTLLPAWSAKDGSRIFYDLYSDGERVKTFEYEVRRKGLIWIVALPFIWANLFTRSEKEAFAITTRQFFAEAAPLLAK